MKKCLLTCFVTFLSIIAISQYRADWRSEVDLLIQEADSLSLKSQKTFTLYKPYHADKDVRENWFYTTRNGNVVIFEVQYVVDSLEYSEIYYLDRGRLICMEQYEAPYLSVYTDQVKRGEAFFFRDNSLKQYVIVGKGGPTPGLYDAFTNSHSRFQKRFAELKRHISYVHNK